MPETSPTRRYRGLQHVNVPSTDLDRSRELYLDRLGLPELPRPAFDVPGVWIAVGPNQAIPITQISEKEPTAAYHLALEVDRLDPLLDELAAKRVARKRFPHVPGAGNQAVVRDPDGNIIELIQHPTIQRFEADPVKPVLSQTEGIAWPIPVLASGPLGVTRLRAARDRRPTGMSVEENKALTRFFYDEIVNQKKRELIDDWVSEDFVEHEVFPGLPARGPRALKASFDMFTAVLTGLRITPDELIGEGDKVAMRGTMSGMHSGEFMGIPPTNKSFKVNVIDVIEYRDGKATAHWGVTDLAAMMEGLGIASEM